MSDSIWQRAIITGASSGLGEEFACQLAPHLEEIVIVARRKDKLKLVRENLARLNSSLNIIVVECDLADAASLLHFIDVILGLPPMPTLLVNNAGLGDYGDFTSAEWERIESMLVLNIFTLTKLTHALLPDLIRNGGGIINVSSLASSLPIPDFAVYAASKSFVLSFSEALRLELREHRVNVLAVCPGPVSTEFGQVARRPGFTGNMMPMRNSIDTPKEQVVSESLRAMVKNKARIYPGALPRFLARLLAATPMSILRLIMGRRPRRTQPLTDRNSQPHHEA